MENNNLNNHLVQWYPLNHSQEDYSTVGNNGTNNGQIFENDYQKFDGIDDYIEILNNESLKLSTELTISALVNPYVFSSQGTICTKNTSYYLQVDQDGSVAVYSYWDNNGINGGSHYTYSNNKIPLNKWTHIAFVETKNGKRYIYINGVLDKIDQAESTIYNSNQNVFIGMESGTGRQFNGKIKDLKIYDKQLSETEIKKVMNESYIQTDYDLYLSKDKVYTNVQDDLMGNCLQIEKGTKNILEYMNLEQKSYSNNQTEDKSQYVKINEQLHVTGGRGIRLVQLNKFGKVIHEQSYDTCGSQQSQQQLQDRLEWSRKEFTSIMVQQDEQSNYISYQLPILEKIGFEKIKNLGYRYQWIGIHDYKNGVIYESEPTDQAVQYYNTNIQKYCDFTLQNDYFSIETNKDFPNWEIIYQSEKYKVNPSLYYNFNLDFEYNEDKKFTFDTSRIQFDQFDSQGTTLNTQDRIIYDTTEIREWSEQAQIDQAQTNIKQKIYTYNVNGIQQGNINMRRFQIEESDIRTNYVKGSRPYGRYRIKNQIKNPKLFSIVTWIKGNDLNESEVQDKNTIMEINPDNQNYIWLYKDGNEAIHVQFNGNNVFSSNYGVIDNRWYLIQFIYNQLDGYFQFSLDGKTYNKFYFSQLDQNIKKDIKQDYMYIGTRNYEFYDGLDLCPLNGYIKNFRVENKEISRTELLKEYNQFKNKKLEQKDNKQNIIKEHSTMIKEPGIKPFKNQTTVVVQRETRNLLDYDDVSLYEQAPDCIKRLDRYTWRINDYWWDNSNGDGTGGKYFGVRLNTKKTLVTTETYCFSMLVKKYRDDSSYNTLFIGPNGVGYSDYIHIGSTQSDSSGKIDIKNKGIQNLGNGWEFRWTTFSPLQNWTGYIGQLTGSWSKDFLYYKNFSLIQSENPMGFYEGYVENGGYQLKDQYISNEKGQVSLWQFVDKLQQSNSRTARRYFFVSRDGDSGQEQQTISEYAGNIEFEFRNNKTNYPIQDLTLGWNMFSMSWDKNNLYIYINDTLYQTIDRSQLNINQDTYFIGSEREILPYQSMEIIYYNNDYIESATFGYFGQPLMNFRNQNSAIQTVPIVFKDTLTQEDITELYNEKDF